MMEWVTVGMMTFPTECKNKIHVQDHQPVNNMSQHMMCFYVCFKSKYVVTNWICILILYNLYVCIDKLAYIEYLMNLYYINDIKSDKIIWNV